MKRVSSLALTLAAVLAITACATFESPGGEEAPFSRLGPCRALAQWLEPVKARYGERGKGGWNETTTRERTKFLFTDPYFVPIFGTPVDALDDRQVAAIRDALGNARSDCTDEPFLQSMYPDIFLARAFDPRLPLTPFSRSFVVGHAIEQRNAVSGPDGVQSGAERRTVRRVQRQLTARGFDAGAADGLPGSKTARAVADYKRAHGLLPVNGDITPALVARLEAGGMTATPPVVTTVPRSTRDERDGPSVGMIDDGPRPARRDSDAAADAGRPAPRGGTAGSGRSTSQPSERVAGTPERFVDDMAHLLTGETIRLTETNMPFLGGASAGVIQACQVPAGFTDRAELVKFVASTGVLSAGGNNYSDENIGRSMRGGLASQALFSSGETVGGRIACHRAERFTDAILRSLRSDALDDDGGPSTFIRTCLDAFDERRCRCLADTGRTVMPGIHRQRYERSVFPTIISRNPLVGMQIIASCGIVDY